MVEETAQVLLEWTERQNLHLAFLLWPLSSDPPSPQRTAAGFLLLMCFASSSHQRADSTSYYSCSSFRALPLCKQALLHHLLPPSAHSCVLRRELGERAGWGQFCPPPCLAVCGRTPLHPNGLDWWKKPARQSVQQGPWATFLTCFTLLPPWAKGEAALDPLCLQACGTRSHHANSLAGAMEAVPTPTTHRRLLSRLPGGAGGAFSPAVCFELHTPANCKVPYLESSRSPERLLRGPQPRQVKQPSWAADSPGPGGTSALSLKGFPPGRREQAVMGQSQPYNSPRQCGWDSSTHHPVPTGAAEWVPSRDIWLAECQQGGPSDGRPTMNAHTSLLSTRQAPKPGHAWSLARENLSRHPGKTPEQRWVPPNAAPPSRVIACDGGTF